MVSANKIVQLNIELFARNLVQILLAVLVLELCSIKPLSAVMTDSMGLRKWLRALIEWSLLMLAMAFAIAALNDSSGLWGCLLVSLDDVPDMIVQGVYIWRVTRPLVGCWGLHGRAG